MRAVIAMVKHETNTFSPVPTPLERFGNAGPLLGAEAQAAYAGTATPMGAFIDLAQAAGLEIITPVAAEAWPSGPASAETFKALCDPVFEAVRRGCDIVLLDLHGAMVTDDAEDAESVLVERLRAMAPDIPIAVALDLHANVGRALADAADVIAGFQTYPHVDMYETGLRAGRAALSALAGQTRPAMAWGTRPMLPHVMRQATVESPMRDLVERARRHEEEGALAVSVFPGFPHADVPAAGLSVVAVTDGDQRLADTICADLLELAWQRRDDFVYRGEAAAAAVARAARLPDGPVLLLDHCDNCGSGGTQDVMVVLGEILRQGLEDVAVFAVHDPAAVHAMIAAGVGAEVTVPLGGKLAMPTLGLDARPLTVTGTVRHVSDGNYVIRGPMYTGVRVCMGRSVVLDTGKVEIVVIERHHEPWDLGCLRSLGIEPSAKRFLMLKSRVHWRAGFWPVVRHVVECGAEGVTTSDYAALPFRRVRRPIFPLDRHAKP